MTTRTDARDPRTLLVQHLRHIERDFPRHLASCSSDKHIAKFTGGLVNITTVGSKIVNLVIIGQLVNELVGGSQAEDLPQLVASSWEELITQVSALSIQ